jgi:predicted dehydrogenase
MTGTKGVTARALNDVSERRGSALVLVNAAYTSQADPRTRLLAARRGDRLHLPGGVVMQADHAAAVNILHRASDPDITLHTPYTRVRQILQDRADRQRTSSPVPSASESETSRNPCARMHRKKEAGDMDPLRVGILGTGWMATEHRRFLTAVADAPLVAVCDLDRERAEAFAGGTGARVYSDWRDMLDREDLAALFVCVPPLAHREPAVTALDLGLPVYLEKPIARTAEDAAAIVAAAQRSGTVCAVGYQWHALDLLDDLSQVLAGQDIGLLVGASIGPTLSRPWFLDRRAGGGNLLERGSHHLDLARTVAGEVGSVQAAAGRVRLARRTVGGGDIDDAVTILLELTSGALATIVVAWTGDGQPGTYALDVVASEATLRLDLDPAYTLSGASRGQPVSQRAKSHPLERSISTFLTAVRERDPSAVICPPPDAAATLAVAAAAERALDTGRAVEVAAP